MDIPRETTDQVFKTPPELRNPDGKGGFGDNPQNRSNGTWDSKNTFSFQMNRFKNMTISELDFWNKNTPKEIRTVAEDLAFHRVFNAQKDLKEFEVVADRTEGKAPQTMVIEGGFFTREKLKIDIVLQYQYKKLIPCFHKPCTI